MFLRARPVDALRLVIVAHGASDVVLTDTNAESVEREGHERVASLAYDAAEAFAAQERREVRFACEWRAGSEVRATHVWRAGQAAAGLTLDGSDTSIVVQMQSFVEKLSAIITDDGMRQLTEGWKELLAQQGRRITSLEKLCSELQVENATLRAQLEKLRAAEHDIAMAEIALEDERGQRQSALLEKYMPELIKRFAPDLLGPGAGKNENQQNGSKADAGAAQKGVSS